MRNESECIGGKLFNTGCTIDRSGYFWIDLSRSTSVGTRKIANYACIG